MDTYEVACLARQCDQLGYTTAKAVIISKTDFRTALPRPEYNRNLIHGEFIVFAPPRNL